MVVLIWTFWKHWRADFNSRCTYLKFKEPCLREAKQLLGLNLRISWLNFSIKLEAKQTCFKYSCLKTSIFSSIRDAYFKHKFCLFKFWNVLFYNAKLVFLCFSEDIKTRKISLELMIQLLECLHCIFINCF